MKTTELKRNRLSTASEFSRNLFKQNLSEDCTVSGVPLYYDNGIVYTDNSDAHTLIFGNTGSKKQGIL